MKRIHKHLYLFVLISAVLTNSFGQSNLSVDVSGAKTIINKEIFGGLMERLGRGVKGGIFVGTGSSVPNVNGIRKDIIDGLNECGFGALQWPGGCAAQGYNWNPPNPSDDLGTDRFMQLCSLTNCTPIITGKSNNTAAASNKAWVRYINDNPNHPDWTLKYFQLGNEVWGCGGNYGCWSNCSAPYKPHYDRNYDSLKVPVNNKPITTIAGTDGIWKFQQWLKDMLADNVNRIENIEIHDYIYFPDNVNHLNFDDNQYWEIVNSANEKQMRSRLDAIISILNQYDPQKRIKIWEGEWGNWLVDDGSDGWRQAGTLMDALCAGETLNLFVRYAERMMGAGLAQVVNVIQSVMNTETTHGAMVKTPTFYVFKMYIPHHTDEAKAAPFTLTSERVNNIPAVSAAASVNKSGTVNVSLTNVDLRDSRTVNVTLTNAEGNFECTSAKVVTGPSKNSYNKYNAQETVNMQDLAASNYSKTGDKSFRVTLPPMSIAMLSFTSPTGVDFNNTVSNLNKRSAFKVGAGSNGSITVSSSVNTRTPVSISLYRLNGKTLLQNVDCTFESGNSSITLGKNKLKKGVYIVKITGNDINLSKQVAVSR